MKGYFTTLQHDPENWLSIVKVSLPYHLHSWFTYIKTKIYNWEDFKSEFIKKYTNSNETQQRMKNLFQQTETLQQPTEQFIFDKYLKLFS